MHLRAQCQPARLISRRVADCDIMTRPDIELAKRPKSRFFGVVDAIYGDVRNSHSDKSSINEMCRSYRSVLGVHPQRHFASLVTFATTRPTASHPDKLAEHRYRHLPSVGFSLLRLATHVTCAEVRSSPDRHTTLEPYLALPSIRAASNSRCISNI